MKIIKKVLLLTISYCILIGFNNVYANEPLAKNIKGNQSNEKNTIDLPNIKAPKKWRIIYAEAGPYIDYAQIFSSTIKALAKIGLIENANFPPIQEATDSKVVWDWLVENAGGDYIEFVKDGFYSADWNEENRFFQKSQILERIREKNDIDMILAFGTAAGIDLATDQHKVPTISISVTDAVQAGIIDSVEDSGHDHVHGQVEIGRYERQLSIFYDIFKFKKLGVPVPNTDAGKASIALPSIEKVSKELNFEIVPCYMDMFGTEEEQFLGLKACISTLSTSSDAIYMTTTTGMQWDKMPQLLEPIIKEGIPSFSQSGLLETKLGILMSIAQSSFDNEGTHSAEAIAKIIGGVKPRDISQVFEGPLGLSINLKMAILIGWNPTFEILAAVDNIYQEIYSYDQIQ